MYLAEVSSDVVELIIHLAQGLDRYLKLGNPLFIMPTYTLCREYVVSQSVLGQFFEWVTTLGINYIRLQWQ